MQLLHTEYQTKKTDLIRSTGSKYNKACRLFKLLYSTHIYSYIPTAVSLIFKTVSIAFLIIHSLPALQSTMVDSRTSLSNYHLSIIYSCFNMFKHVKCTDSNLSASVVQLDAPSDWRPGGRGFNPRRDGQHSFVEIDHEIFSTVILSLPLIQEGQLSVSGERMCTILVDRLED